MLKNFKPRLYQETIFATAARYNSLVVLPTGLGKTAVAIMLAAQRLKQYPNSKILMLAPTKPLVEQIMRSFQRFINLEENKIVMFTGYVKPAKRKQLWKTAKIIISTPQGLENDIINKNIDISKVSLLILDEAHRAVGDYSYVWIADQYHKKGDFAKILGLTASPGSDLEKITEVCENLFIEKVEVKTDKDPDVKPYVQKMNIKWTEVKLPEEFLVIKKILQDCFKSKLKKVKEFGYLNSIQINASKLELIKIQRQLQKEIINGNRNFELMRSVSLIAEAMKVQHALELIETQGIIPLFTYLQKMEEQASSSKVKAVQNLVKDVNFKRAYIKTHALIEDKVEHPKIQKLKDIINKKKGKTIVFSQYRDSGDLITKELEKEGKKTKLFVGQAKKRTSGLSQKKQLQMLQEFRDGKFDILVSTSVGEEGLDICEVDNVIFYEPVPSAIRTIQRRGRTARQKEGDVIVLVAKDTRDVAYRWTAFHKEKRMYRILKKLKKEFNVPRVIEKSQKTIQEYNQNKEKIKIIIDFREKGSKVIKELINLGIDVSLENLDSADFLLSSNTAVEYKTVPDFVQSIIDGRLLTQLRFLKKNFKKCLILIEGEQDIYSIRKIHQNAINGMLATIAVSYGIPILFTKNEKETANLFSTIAKREQLEQDKEWTMHFEKPKNIKEQQEYIVSSLPGIERTIAKNLLQHFGSVKRVFLAPKDELKKVELIGDKKAERIRKVVDLRYEN